MAEQARLFGDHVRRKELLSAGKDPAPHKAFDHKAPKTGQRRVQNFSADVWQRYRDILMWTATYEKFYQNVNLKKRILQCGKRVFVEATDDLIWGIGISLGHPDIYNTKKWRGPNTMGIILTKVKDLIILDESCPNYSESRILFIMDSINKLYDENRNSLNQKKEYEVEDDYLEDLDTNEIIETKVETHTNEILWDRTMNFVKQCLQFNKDNQNEHIQCPLDMFPPPCWPGTSNIMQLHGELSNFISTDDGKDTIILNRLSKMIDFVRSNPNFPLQQTEKTLLYLVEASLGIRMY